MATLEQVVGEPLLLQEPFNKFPGDLLVIGAGSLVGSRFIEQLGPQSSLYGAGLRARSAGSPCLRGFNQLDVLDLESIKDVLGKTPGRFVINFSAYTNVGQTEKERPSDPKDQSQLDRDSAYQLNVLGTRNILEASAQAGKFPIFISTDFVFDGENGPYSETDSIAQNPAELTWYGWTKKLAEDEVVNAGLDYLMLRISYPYRGNFPGKGDFGRDMLEKAATRNPDGSVKFNYPLFTDQRLSPTFIDDLAPAVTALVRNGCKGTYHLASPGIVTPFEFGCEIYRFVWGLEDPECLVPRGRLADILKDPAKTRRPLHGGLTVAKIIQDTGFVPTDWRWGLHRAYSGD